MKKYQKLLVTCALVSLPLIQSVKAVDLHYTIKGIDITLNNVRTDAIYGIRFDTMGVNDELFTEADINDGIEDIFTTPDDELIEFNGEQFSAADIKEALDLLQGKYQDAVIAQITSDLTKQGISVDEQNHLKQGFAQVQSERSSVVSAREGKTTIKQVIEQVQKTMTPMTYSATAQVIDIVDTRTDTVDTADRLASNQGMAAGDMGYEFKHGIWIKGNASKDSYKLAGLKLNARTAGAVIGYDVKINDNVMAGLAFGYQHNHLSQKLKLRSLVGLVYGRYNFDMPIFVDAKYSYSASVFTGKAKNTSIDLLALGINNFHTISTEVGYNHALAQNLEITPTAGLKYIVHNWKLSKKWLNNRSVKAKNGSAAYATFGIKLKGMIDNDSYLFMPYVSAGFDSRIAHRKTKLTITNSAIGKSTVLPVDVAEKTKFTAGTGVTAKINEIFSASLGYKYTKTKLYHSHGGTLGLRFDF